MANRDSHSILSSNYHGGNQRSESSSSTDITIHRRQTGSGESGNEAVIRQPVFIRYLEPYGGPDITNVTLPQLPPQAPIVIIQQQEEVHSTKPVVFRELPREHDKFITIQKPSQPPIPIVIEKIPRQIPKPPPILIERWLPSRSEVRVETVKPKKLKREITVIEHRKPKVTIVKQYINLGTRKVDRDEYLRMLNNKAHSVTLGGKSLYLESRLSWDKFEEETGTSHQRRSQESVLNPLTIVSNNELRI